ncbi:hypothetical protein GCM10009584_12770 [Ornithinimicrobium humiphilum]|uniref:histidine kinase n=1 Tax=Ornithinimicrobium humiphilum TaxID=125288 RepID=A0A543KJX2_9MICO|nr:histidine kinase [Ornithinimicrobium humiphilum]TQM95377.1 signal transduction histidine kinase [Ornithinimicrobium humiphilum]
MSIEGWFGTDEDWVRPRPRVAEARDVRLALASLVTVALGAEVMRSLGAFSEEPHGVAWQYLGMVSLVALVLVRRTHPVLVTAVTGVHMITLGVLLPMTMSSLPMQLLYFFLIFSGVAWARDRRMLLAAVGLVIALMVAWVAWAYAVGSGMQQLTARFAEDVPEQIGIFDVPTAVAGFMLLNNGLFFGGAILLGQLAWRGARNTARVVEQAGTIAAQSLQLRDQAVVAERLRIARELHDVVAHHVSVMGVQAAAARRVMERDPSAASAALGTVEKASREAVGQMRDLVGTLRSGELESGGARPEEAGDRSPQPTLAALPALVAGATTPTCEVTFQLVEDREGAAGRVPPPVQLSAYRVVQEALANVHRHSTARHVSVVVRVEEEADRLEVEVVDDGLQRAGTAGTGLGLLGMRERADHLGGGVEAGPRTASQGWRVRLWCPLDGIRRSGPAGLAPVEVGA